MEEKILTREIAIKLIKKYLKKHRIFKLNYLREYFRDLGYTHYLANYTGRKHEQKTILVMDMGLTQILRKLKELNLADKISTKCWESKLWKPKRKS